MDDATIRFCVCGHSFDLTKPETREHDHEGRERVNRERALCAQVDGMVEEEAARRV